MAPSRRRLAALAAHVAAPAPAPAPALRGEPAAAGGVREDVIRGGMVPLTRAIYNRNGGADAFALLASLTAELSHHQVRSGNSELVEALLRHAGAHVSLSTGVREIAERPHGGGFALGGARALLTRARLRTAGRAAAALPIVHKVEMGSRLSRHAASADGKEGNQRADTLPDEEAEALAIRCHFEVQEIKNLYIIFNNMDEDKNGTLEYDEMMKLPHLKYNPLGKRVIVATFQTKEHKSADTLSFNDFVEVLSVFAPAASDQEKLKLAFKVFDFDGDRFLGRSDLEQLITALLPPATTDEDKKLHTHILDEVFREADQDQDEKLSYDEFLKAVAHSDIRSKLTIAF